MQSEILKLEEELRIAMLNNDVEKLDELIADSLVFTTPDGKIATKSMDLEAHRSKIQKMTKLSPCEQTIQIYDNFAVVTVKMTLKGTYSEVDISGNYRYTRIWAKINNNWKILAGAVVLIP